MKLLCKFSFIRIMQLFRASGIFLNLLFASSKKYSVITRRSVAARRGCSYCPNKNKSYYHSLATGLAF